MGDAAGPRALVVGVGNRLRGDDGAGLEAVRRIASAAPQVDVMEIEGEPVDLISSMDGVDTLVVIDAVRSGAAPGTVRRVDVGGAPVPAGLRAGASTHAIGVADAIELARALGRLPARALLYGVEGASFAAGTGLSPAVETGVAAVVDAVVAGARAGKAPELPLESDATGL